MNYIKHLSAFFDKVSKDERLNPTHISLYISLFQFWNTSRFHNPISISRNEVMKISKICAKATYHKCIKDLHNFGYIKYDPSYNPFRGSLVYINELMIPVTQIKYPNYTKKEATIEPVLNKQESGTEQALASYINTKNIEKNVNLGDAPTVEDCIIFFKNQNYAEVEAHKFFNHYQANGWKVGGKAPMKDWKAAARNWMLNAQKFENQKNEKPNRLTSTTDKNYSEPL